MIPVKINSTEIFAYDFDRESGDLVQAELDTIRRWKRAIDAWQLVQSEMGKAVEASKPPPEPLPPPLTQWAGIPKVEMPQEPQRISQVPVPEAVAASGESVAFDSRSYLGSGISSGVPKQPGPIHEQSEQLSISAEIGGPAANLRQQGNKGKADGTRPKVKDRPSYQKSTASEMDLE